MIKKKKSICGHVYVHRLPHASLMNSHSLRTIYTEHSPTALINCKRRIRTKCEISSGTFALTLTEDHTSLPQVLFYFLPLNRWLWQAPSIINDQWWAVKLRNERHITISSLRCDRESKGNTGYIITSKTIKEIKEALVLLVSKQLGNLMKSAFYYFFFKEWWEFSGAASCRDAGAETLLWKSGFFTWITIYNHWYPCEKEEFPRKMILPF